MATNIWVNIALLLLVSLTSVGVCSARIALREPDPDPPDLDNISKYEHKAMAKKMAYRRLPVINKANHAIPPSEPVKPPPRGGHDHDHPNDLSTHNHRSVAPLMWEPEPPKESPSNYLNDFSTDDDYSVGILSLPPPVPMDHPNIGFSKINDQRKDLNYEAVGGAGNAVFICPPCTTYGGGCSPLEELTLAIQQLTKVIEHKLVV